MAVTGPALASAAGATTGPAVATTERIDPTRLGSPRRRAVAWTVDLALVLVPLAALIWSQADRTDAASEPAGTAGWAMSVGGTRYHWSGPAVALCAVGALLLGLTVLALLPANTGSTPGLRLVRLRVLATDGTRARLHQHLVRNLVGLADLAPFVLPGLVGWWTAAHSPLRQRLGDRVAGTVVVEHRHPERPVDPDGSRTPWWRFQTDPLLADDPDGSDRALSPAREAELLRRWLSQPADEDRIPTAPAAILPSRATRITPVDRPPDDDGPSAPSRFPLRSIIGHDHARGAGTDDSDPEGAARPPRFARRRPPTGTATGTPTEGAPAAAPPEPAVHRPRFSRVIQPSERAATDPAVAPIIGGVRTVPPPAPRTTPELGPVPADPGTGPAERLALRALAAAPEPHPAPVSAPTPAAAKTPAATPTPTWSDELQAWTYTDPGSGRLFLHDPDRGGWLPAP